MMQRRPFLQAAGFSAVSTLLGAARSAPLATVPRGTPSPDVGNWSFVVLPDTQCYTESHPEVFVAQTEWIARQRHLRNIQFVLHEGDITNNNVHPEWINARRAMDVLRTAAIPHLLVPGNHDMGPWGSATTRDSHFSDYFIQRNGMERGRSENAYLTIDIGETKLLIVGLEFAPRTAAVAWAKGVVAKFPERHAILLTHAYLYSDGTRYDWPAKERAQSWNPNGYGVASLLPVHDGEALWQQLVSRHPQFLFTFNGHVLNDGIGYLASPGTSGNMVHQMLVNYQCGVQPDRKRGGGGFLRLVTVQEDGRTVEVSDYSPYYDEWLTEADRKFTITLDRDLNAAPPRP